MHNMYIVEISAHNIWNFITKFSSKAENCKSFDDLIE